MKTRAAFVPQSAKGDILLQNAFGGRARFPVGTPDQILTVDPMEPLGVKWVDRSGLGSFSVTFNAESSGDSIWTNMPNAEEFFMNDHRHVIKADLSNFTQARLIANRQLVAAASGALLELQYRTAFSTTPGDYSPAGTSAITVPVDTTNTVEASDWIDLASAARADVFLALIGSLGGNTHSPTFGTVMAVFR